MLATHLTREMETQGLLFEDPLQRKLKRKEFIFTSTRTLIVKFRQIFILIMTHICVCREHPKAALSVHAETHNIQCPPEKGKALDISCSRLPDPSLGHLLLSIWQTMSNDLTWHGEKHQIPPPKSLFQANTCGQISALFHIKAKSETLRSSNQSLITVLTEILHDVKLNQFAVFLMHHS